MLPPEQRRRGGQKAPRVLVRRTDGRIEVDNLSEHARDWAAVAAAARIRTIMSALDPEARDGFREQMERISSRRAG
jgi:3-keto-L-gulonate-6-phosphate decarboxylase